MDLDESATTSGGERIPARVRRIVFLGVLGAIVLGVLVGGVLIARREPTLTEDQVKANLLAVVTTAQQEIDSSRRFDLAKLRSSLSDESSGYIIDLESSEDRKTVGVAARQPDGTSCVLLWSATGAPLAVTVTDPVLPCRAEIALAAAS